MAKDLSGLGWSAERETVLRKLWDEGISVTLIAGAMHISRNSVIGKAHRLGLSARENPVKKRSAGAPRISLEEQKRRNAERQSLRRAAEKERAGKPAPVPRPPTSFAISPRPPRQVVPDDPRVGTFVLEEVQANNSCRMPIGERPHLRFCGKERKEGSPYCPKCHARCHSSVFYAPDDRRMPRSML